MLTACSSSITCGYIHDVVGVGLLGQQGEAEGGHDEQRHPQGLPRRQEEGQREEERQKLNINSIENIWLEKSIELVQNWLITWKIWYFTMSQNPNENLKPLSRQSSS